MGFWMPKYSAKLRRRREGTNLLPAVPRPSADFAVQSSMGAIWWFALFLVVCIIFGGLDYFFDFFSWFYLHSCLVEFHFSDGLIPQSSRFRCDFWWVISPGWIMLNPQSSHLEFQRPWGNAGRCAGSILRTCTSTESPRLAIGVHHANVQDDKHCFWRLGGSRYITFLFGFNMGKPW